MSSDNNLTIFIIWHDYVLLYAHNFLPVVSVCQCMQLCMMCLHTNNAASNFFVTRYVTCCVLSVLFTYMDNWCGMCSNTEVILLIYVFISDIDCRKWQHFAKSWHVKTVQNGSRQNWLRNLYAWVLCSKVEQMILWRCVYADVHHKLLMWQSLHIMYSFAFTTNVLWFVVCVGRWWYHNQDYD